MPASFDLKAALQRKQGTLGHVSRQSGAPKDNPAPPKTARAGLGGPAARTGGPAPERTLGPMRRVREQQDIERTLPHSIEAEQGVLGSIIIDPRAIIPLVLGQINEDYFYVPVHRTIYTVACALFADEGMFDLVTLTQHLRDRNLLDTVGGPAFVTSLFTFVPTSANVGYYLDIVREKYILRQVIIASTESIRLVYEHQGGDVGELVLDLQKRTQWLTTIASPRTRLPPLRDLSQMLGSNKPERPTELVRGVLHQGSKLIVGGTSKGRKTYSLLDFAVSVATGARWWGFDCHQGPVCYINFEIQEAFFCDRVEMICKAKGVMLDTAQLVGWNLRGHGEGIEHLMQELLEELLRRRFVLIIFDPIYKALGNRDENKAGDVASMLNELEKIAVQTGAAIGFGAHYSKGNQVAKEAVDRIGGSGVFARDPDSILTMTPHEEDDAFTVDMTLRNFRPHLPFVVRWRGNIAPDYFPIFERADELDPENLKQPNNPGAFSKQFSENDLLNCLEILNGIKPKEVCARLYDSINMSRSTVYRLKNELEAKGLFEERNGLWFRRGRSTKSE